MKCSYAWIAICENFFPLWSMNINFARSSAGQKNSVLSFLNIETNHNITFFSHFGLVYCCAYKWENSLMEFLIITLHWVLSFTETSFCSWEWTALGHLGHRCCCAHQSLNQVYQITNVLKKVLRRQSNTLLLTHGENILQKLIS